MKDEREGQVKVTMLEDAKENAELVQFIKSLTKEEIKRIRETREFETIKVGTPTYKIAILCDQLRQSLRTTKAHIAKRLWTIDSLSNNIDRLQLQLTTGEITEQMKQGIIMNKEELSSLIQHNRWLKDGEFSAVYALLADLRGLVGHKDLAKKVIMTIEEFDKFVLDIETYLKKYGYNLFGEFDAR